MTHSFEVYIDESGCEGFKFRPPPQPGSPDWFVLSAAIIPISKRSSMLKMVKAAKAAIAPQRKHLHFADLSHSQRIAWIHQISESDVILSSVCINKPKLTSPDTFKKKDRLYFYATRFLLERVSWMCRDHHPRQPGDGTAKLFFSKRKNMSYDDLHGYLNILREQRAINQFANMLLYDIRIDWKYIRSEKVEVRPHMDLAGLQIADAACGAFRTALEYSKHHFTEHRFAKMLKDRVYCRRTWTGAMNYHSYGLKFFPSPPSEDEKRRPRYNWIGKYYSR